MYRSLLLFLTILAPAAKADQAQLRAVASCASIALIETGNYPAAVKVYRDELPAANQEEAIEAYIGAIWTNRSVVLRETYGWMYHQYGYGNISRGEVASEIEKWISVFSSAVPEQQLALIDNCDQIWLGADQTCAAEGCLAEIDYNNEIYQFFVEEFGKIGR